MHPWLWALLKLRTKVHIPVNQMSLEYRKALEIKPGDAAPFEDEKKFSYEGGLKATLPDGPMQFNFGY